jgi:hypothetical protein
MARIVNNFVLTLALFACVCVARAQSTIEGYWVCQNGCGCRPTSPDQFASVTPVPDGFSVRNECGFHLSGTSIDGKALSIENGLVGTLSTDSQLINWSNGSVWARLPASTTELDKGLAYWESKAFYCAYGDGSGRAFPTKEGEALDPSCDDGDAVIMNALLCGAGDHRGCATVADAQDAASGKWWRSPVKRISKPDEPDNFRYDIRIEDGDLKVNKPGQTTFSDDHALGTMMFLGLTHDKAAFDAWMAFIDHNGRCSTFCGAVPVGSPRFCEEDRCTFRLIDCPAFQLLADHLGTIVPFCSLTLLPVPTVTFVVDTVQKQYDETFGRIPDELLPPGAKHGDFSAALSRVAAALKTVEDLRAKADQAINRRLHLANIIEELSGAVAGGGEEYSIHNVIVLIWMIEQWGYGSSQLSDLAMNISNSRPENPFYHFIGHKGEDRDDTLAKTLVQCPSEDRDTQHRRWQWSWERRFDSGDYKNTMYWDCIFIAELLRNKTLAPPDRDYSAEEQAALEQYKFAVSTLKSAGDTLETLLTLLRDVNLLPVSQLPQVPRGFPNPPAPPNPRQVLEDLGRLF